jgi:uncharacterized protein YgiM (DUF1202 family)
MRTAILRAIGGLTALAFAASAPAVAQAQAYIAAQSANCRAGPATSAPVVVTLGRGAEVTVEERRNGWALVDPAEGHPCWVSEILLSEGGSNAADATHASSPPRLLSQPARVRSPKPRALRHRVSLPRARPQRNTIPSAWRGSPGGCQWERRWRKLSL